MSNDTVAKSKSLAVAKLFGRSLRVSHGHQAFRSDSNSCIMDPFLFIMHVKTLLGHCKSTSAILHKTFCFDWKTKDDQGRGSAVNIQLFPRIHPRVPHTYMCSPTHAHRCGADGSRGPQWWKEIIGEKRTDGGMRNIVEANAWDKHTWAHAGNRLRGSDFHPLSNWHPKTVTSPSVPLWDGKIDIRRVRDRRTRLEQEISKETRWSCCFVQFSLFHVKGLNALEVVHNSLSSLSFFPPSSLSLCPHARYPICRFFHTLQRNTALLHGCRNNRGLASESCALFSSSPHSLVPPPCCR